MSTKRASGIAVSILLSMLAHSDWAYASSAVFDRVAPATALVLAGEDEGIRLGSGVLIDRSRRLILTAAHVVANKQTLRIVFPESSDGRLITSSAHYLNNFGDRVVLGKATWVDVRRDIAIVQLERIPAHVPAAVPLATTSPTPGETVFAVGNSSLGLGGLFGMVSGMIRSVYERSWDGVTVIDSTIPTNQGDSGGPVVNSQGELVGIVSMGTTGQDLEKDNPLYAKQSLDLSIDISEIQHVLGALEVPDAVVNTNDPLAGLFSESDIEALNETFSVVDSAIRDAGFDNLDDFVNWEIDTAFDEDSNAAEPRDSSSDSCIVVEGVRIPRGLMADAFYGR